MKKQKIDSFRKAEAWAQVKSARSRMDLILSTVNSGGIIVSLEFGKFLMAEHKPVHLLLNVALILFVIGIAISFLSQRFSYKSNWEAYMHESALEVKNYSDAETHERTTDCYNERIKLANTVNNIVTWLGVVCLVVPFLIISWGA